MPSGPVVQDDFLDTPLRQLSLDLPGRTLRQLLEEGGLKEYLVSQALDELIAAGVLPTEEGP